ncbi:diacylglycerol/lipid kinase family protein [Paracoccus aerodenitrificans]|uniref:diacylglycerol/lipid kinase family protein n=1 Tax=Paracoccus aerodenitrificans TaxID=3017781 RepID=UPI0022F11EAF|nr:diacylglycerol kinase family protein [Paracoccus aerodenitrificans]WBU63294.1 diacylglycerol kinase family protein [Paracoccus aerodenitrificans]
MTERFDLSRARVAAIMNRKAGSGNGESVGAMLEDRIAPACAGFTMIRPQKGQNIVSLAADTAREHDVIIAVGGDGTQAAVAQALADADTEKVMGVIPGGTFNYFARDLGVGETPEAAIDTLLNARIENVSVGDMNGKVFLNNISLGAYPEILERREDAYRRFGRRRVLAYWAVLRTLMDLRHPLQLTAIVDGEKREFRTALAFVAQSETQLEAFGLEGADDVRRDRLPLFIAKAERAVPLIGAALRLALGISAHGEDFELIISEKFIINTDRPTRHVAHDGERSRVPAPLNLSIRKDALRVLVPAEKHGDKED